MALDSRPSALSSKIGSSKRPGHCSTFQLLVMTKLVVPEELKVIAWNKADRKGSGEPGAGGTVHTGRRAPWGAEVEYADANGYDNRGRLSVNRTVDERGYSIMLKQRKKGVA